MSSYRVFKRHLFSLDVRGNLVARPAFRVAENEVNGSVYFTGHGLKLTGLTLKNKYLKLQIY